MSESAVITVGIGAPMAILGACVLPFVAAGLVCAATARLLTNLAGELKELPSSGLLDEAMCGLRPGLSALEAVPAGGDCASVQVACELLARALDDLRPAVRQTLAIATRDLSARGRAAIAEASALAAAGDAAAARSTALQAAEALRAAHRQAVGALSRAEREVTAAAYREVLVHRGFANVTVAEVAGVSAITATRGSQEVAVAVRDGGRSLLDIAGCEAAWGSLSACRPMQQEILQGLRDLGLTTRTETVHWNGLARGGVLLRPAYVERRRTGAPLAGSVARIAAESAGRTRPPVALPATEDRRRAAPPVRESDR